MSADPYVYPGTDTLRNLLDIRERTPLEAAERMLTAARMRQRLPEISMSPEGYRALHRHVFQDVYPWAGEYRTCELWKSGWFEEAKHIPARMERQFAVLNAADNLRGLSARDFARRAAGHLCELNDIHPFREGNGRVNRLFAQVLARQAGWELRLGAIRREDWMHASQLGFHRMDYGGMEALLARALTARSRGREQER